MTINQKDPKPQKQFNPYIRFTTVAFQMGATIYLGNLLGKWLDSKYITDFWESIITLLSIFIAIYQVISQVIKVSKKDD
ncbi:AtpZ/AtpI family protein [Confluentibacter lentus]|uniref:AtpZ/AtpI family protein n=1 Tax=Confluentibacter lentus TaxID=1699412 RepID=UPI0021D0CC56|nr:AtpZ/AtpI family protein [Confluentibacter lentus]